MDNLIELFQKFLALFKTEVVQETKDSLIQEYGEVWSQDTTLTEQDVKSIMSGEIDGIKQRLQVLESSTPDPIDPDPIDPDPIDPDPVLPTVTIILPASQAEFIEGDTVEVEAEAVAYGGASVQTVDFFLNNSDTPYKTEKQYRYQAPLSGLTTGEYTVHAKVTDSNGASSTSAPVTFSVYVDVTGGDPIEPLPGDLTTVEPNSLGVFDIELNTLAPITDWAETDREGSSQGKSLIYLGQDQFNNPGTAEMSFYLNVTDPGDYRVRLRSLIGKGTNQTESNDIWLKIEGAQIYGMKNGATINFNIHPVVNGYAKIYQNELGAFTWNTFVVDNDPHGTWVNFPSAGLYKVLLSARSSGFVVDKLVIHKPSVSDEDALVVELVDPIDPDPIDPPTSGSGGDVVIDPVLGDPASGSILIDDVLENGKQWFSIKSEEYGFGPITEQEFKTAEPQWEDVKSHSGDEMQAEFGVFPVMFREESNPNFIRLVDPKGGSDPWWKKFLAKSADPIGASMEGETAVIEFELFFPKHNMKDDGTYNGWLPDKHGKFMSGVQLASGVGNTGQNPQPDGVAEVAFGWYGPDSTALINNKDAKGDWYDTNWPAGGMDQGPDSTYLGWGLYVHDPRSNYGHKYQQHIYGLDDLDQKIRKPFKWDTLYKSRALFRLNTPGQFDGVLYWEVSENGGPYVPVRFETDIDYRGNSTAKWADSGFAFFPGGGDGSFLLEGLTRSFYFNNVTVTVA